MIDELKQWEYDRGYEKGKTDILDKIRAEIIQNRESNTYGEYDKIFELCLLIIDKYKAESEG